MRRWSAIASFGTALGALALSQTVPARPVTALPQAALPAELKNVQVLKGLSHDEIIWAMGFISQSLGVTCEHCHVRGNGGFQFELDDKKEKRTAREMLLMTKGINVQHFAGQQRVTCATCHNGGQQPRRANPIVDLEALKVKVAAQSQAAKQAEASTSLPKAADLLAKYEQAIGGEAALGKLNTRIEKYVSAGPNGNSQGESIHKAPDKLIEAINPGTNHATTWFCDGTNARLVSPAHVEVIKGLDLEDVKFKADFWRTLKLTDRYSNATTTDREAINGHEAYVVEGQVKGSGIKEQLFLDADSGLLLRRIAYKPTMLGPLADQTDFEDYRSVSGVKVPFVVKVATGAAASTRTYTDVQFNVPIDDAKFLPAEGEGAPGQSKQ